MKPLNYLLEPISPNLGVVHNLKVAVARCLAMAFIQIALLIVFVIIYLIYAQFN